ncbi:hypothetical protein POX_g09225 [Penicillium oxalicum]|uniref:Uncharacterized protein n=1 Tax=Penicillium oxalicum (strain 114-2 / CGMCC 5302) TaxID=933388 RepID=S7Z8G0_PENO1|nr:hypothetical protein POX_g09225 [Penicillium oxalicum]EPS26479.1 hypothetical protein PDE_01416 [Penicillium oxalicum 114-2]KAI2786830.1 hypothetical protein POX_g09225 [Penicillium oxalicum]
MRALHLSILPLITLISSTLATNPVDWWYFDAWDGLSCGDLPQNGQLFFTADGTGSEICINLNEGQRAYSYAASFGKDDTVVQGFLNEHCEGPSKVLLNNTCTNPDVEIPYAKSWKIVSGADD